MRRVKFINSGFYHIYNRGVEKRKIFLDNRDHYRFIHDLYEFNDLNNVLNVNYYFHSDRMIPKDHKRDLLVEIICYCLMPNHYHLILRQKKEFGISKFIKKIGIGYTNYFNKKYKRSGVLFQGKFKAVAIENDAQLLHLSRYIHLNPVDLVKQTRMAKNFLESYRWSSYLDYIGKNNFPSLINKWILKYYNSTQEESYRKFVENFAFKDLNVIQDKIIESDNDR